MTGLVRHNPSFYSGSDEGEISYKIQQLVPSALVRKMEADIVKITFRKDIHFADIEQSRHSFQRLVRNRMFHDYYGVFQVPSLDEIIIKEVFQFMEENKRAAWSHIRGIIYRPVKMYFLDSEDMRVEIDCQVDRELISRIYRYLRSGLLVAVVNGLLNFEIGPRLFLFLQTVRADSLNVRESASVQYRDLRSTDRHLCIVHPEAGKS